MKDLAFPQSRLSKSDRIGPLEAACSSCFSSIWNRQPIADNAQMQLGGQILRDFDRYKRLQPVFLGGGLLVNAHHAGIDHLNLAIMGPR